MLAASQAVRLSELVLGYREFRSSISDRFRARALGSNSRSPYVFSLPTRSRSREMASWRVPCGNRPCLNFPAQSRQQATWRQHSNVGSILFIALFEDATPFV